TLVALHQYYHLLHYIYFIWACPAASSVELWSPAGHCYFHSSLLIRQWRRVGPFTSSPRSASIKCFDQYSAFCIYYKCSLHLWCSLRCCGLYVAVPHAPHLL